ncbi:MAG: formylglycine-generating enzyme family protein, partial [Planctomycetota bacterium]|nr:formylglycine-generating enzyme family protein [Planctomycetota bacterium]
MLPEKAGVFARRLKVWRHVLAALALSAAFFPEAGAVGRAIRPSPVWESDGIGDPWLWPEDDDDAFLPPGKGEYERAMREGDAHLAAGRYREAEGAYRKALSAAGYADDAAAKRKLDEAVEKREAELREREEALRKREAAVAEEEKKRKEKEELAAAAAQSRPETLQLALPGGAPLEFRLIPAGTFLMGSPASEAERDDNEVQHEVTLTKAFYMGIYEVTQAQWRAVMGNNPSRFKGDRRPVESVSWEDATAFCRKASELTGRKLRLPTEAEWEYACRAGTRTVFNTGDTINTDQAN